MRLANHLFLLGVLLAVVVAKDSTCLGKNQFLASMKTAEPIGVTIHQNVKDVSKANFTTCAAEWKAHGTCCNLRDLLAFYKHEDKILKEHNVRIVGASWMIGHTLGFVKSRPPVVTAVIDRLNVFSGSVLKCFDQLLDLRGPALCSICSGRSEVFFNENKDKVFINMDSCSKAVEECEPYFLTFAWLAAQKDQLFKEVKTNANSDTFANVVSQFSRLENYTPPQELIKAFGAYDKAKSSTNTGFEKEKRRAALCSHFVNIRKKPFTKVNDKYIHEIEGDISYELELEKLFYPAFLIVERSKKQEKNLNEEYGKAHKAFGTYRNAGIKNLKDRTDITEKEKENKIKEFCAMTDKANFKKYLDYIAKKVLIRENAKKKIEKLAATNKAFREFLEKHKRKPTGDRVLSLIQAKRNAKPTKEGEHLRLSLHSDKSRRLNEDQLEATESFSVFSDSQVLVKTDDDSMWAAFDGAPGTQLAHENSPMMAMNLTLAFP